MASSEQSVFVGETYGQLTVLAEAPGVPGERGAIARRRSFLCRCSCGREKVVRASNLARGNSRSCSVPLP